MELTKTTWQFQLVYTLSNLGGCIAFLPLLTLILPEKINAIVADEPIVALSWILFAGGVMASLANIAAGLASDRWIKRFGDRRGMIGLALIAVSTSFFVLGQAETKAEILMAVLWFQLSFNFLFAPMAALLSDYVPNDQKGFVSGLLGLGLPVSSLSVTAMVNGHIHGPTLGLSLVAIVVIILILPLIVFWPRMALVAAPADGPDPVDMPKRVLQDFQLAWFARLFVQFSGATMVNYLYYFVGGVSGFGAQFPNHTAADGVGQLTLVSTLVGLIAGLVTGKLSDHFQNRRGALVIAALLVTVSMAILALVPVWYITLIAYGVFSTGLTAFLAIDSAMVAQLVMGSKRRGGALGVMNLTNTIPAILVPLVTLIFSELAAEGGQVKILILFSSLLAVLAAVLVHKIRTVR